MNFSFQTISALSTYFIILIQFENSFQGTEVWKSVFKFERCENCTAAIMHSITRSLTRVCTLTRLPKISSHRFSTETKLIESSNWFNHTNDCEMPGKIRNVRGCVPHNTHQLVQKLTENIDIDSHHQEMEKCSMNLTGIYCREWDAFQWSKFCFLCTRVCSREQLAPFTLWQEQLEICV